MQVSRYLLGFMLLVGALPIAPAHSQDAKAGDIVILQPWLRAAPRGAESTGGYLTIENKGTAADRLLGISTDVAAKFEIQQLGKSGGGLTVQPVAGGLAIPAGDKVVLAPGSYRLALMDLKQALKKGAKVPVTLQFEKAGKVEVTFDVLSAGSSGPPAPPKAKAGAAADDGKMKK